MDFKKTKELITALRSEEYKQGRSRLKSGDQYCCLGVLCDINTGDRYIWLTDTFYDKEIHATATSLPPDDIMKFISPELLTKEELRRNAIAVLEERGYGKPDVGSILSVCDSLPSILIEMNDSGVPFAVIAEFLERVMLKEWTLEDVMNPVTG